MVKVAHVYRGCGQNHPKAVLTDHEVELLRRLRDEGWTYGQLVRKFEIPKATVAALCKYRTR